MYKVISIDSVNNKKITLSRKSNTSNTMTILFLFLKIDITYKNTFIYYY